MPYIDPSVIEQVKRIDLLTYLQNREPDELVRLSNSTYSTKTHDSLKISNGRWYWWSQGFGGRSALDYLIKVRGMSFLDAVAQLDGCKGMSSAPVRREAHKALSGLTLPLPAPSNIHVQGYLGLRGIDPLVTSHCLKTEIVYETMHGTKPRVVFVGRDDEGAARYAAVRDCSGDFKGEAKGSDKRFAFRLAPTNPTRRVHVFEGAIDLLSYATLVLDGDEDFRELSLLSLGGIQAVCKADGQTRLPQSLTHYLARNPQTKRVCLHFDNDAPGVHATDTIASALVCRDFNVSIEPPPEGNDFNDYLMKQRKVVPPEQIELNLKDVYQRFEHPTRKPKTNTAPAQVR